MSDYETSMRSTENYIDKVDSYGRAYDASGSYDILKDALLTVSKAILTLAAAIHEKKS